MSIIPEVILQRAIMNGFVAIRKDPRIINVLFKNLPLGQQEAIKKYVLEKVIDFSINYPKTEPKIPSIILLMKSENESQEFLNDLMGAPPNYDMPDQDVEYDTLGGSGASVSNAGGLPDLVLGNLHILAMSPDRTWISFTEPDQEVINEVFSVKPNWPAMNLHVVQGAGAGKTYGISRITSSRLDITSTFELDLDSTSVVDIRLTTAPEAAYGSPVRLYESSISQLRIGANYDAQYQLDILAGNQEEVIYLYTVLKAVLFAQRSFLEAQGVMNLRVSGSDLAPRSELLPDETFMRTMTLQFSYPFNFITEQEAAQRIQLVLSTTAYPYSETVIAQIEL